MLRGYRLAIIALGLTLLLGGQAEPDQPEASAGEAATQEQWPPLPLPVQVVEEEAKKEARERIEQDARKREIDDLAAQRGMNEASQRMADAAEVQTWIVGFGMALVLATLIVTVLANKAAFKMIRVTEDTARRQLRAYVVIDKVEIRSFEVGKPLDIHISMKNCGQTPASDYRGWYTIDITPYILSGEYDGISYETWSRYPLGPGMPASAYPESPIIVTQHFFDMITKGTEILRVWGRDEYTDIFGKSHFLEYRYTHRGPVKCPQRMLAHKEGNRTS